jgi:hypothetical protein
MFLTSSIQRCIAEDCNNRTVIRHSKIAKPFAPTSPNPGTPTQNSGHLVATSFLLFYMRSSNLCFMSQRLQTSIFPLQLRRHRVKLP